MTLAAILFAGLVVPAPSARHYGERLLADVARRHSDVVALQILPTDGGPAIGSGAPSPLDVPERVPLASAMGASIGFLDVTTRPGCYTDATAIAREIGRHVFVPSDLAAPDPLVAETHIAPRAQALVEQALDRFPDLITIALHIKMPDNTNRILASNFGRIGKPGDSDDDQVIRDAATRMEVTNGGRRLAVELPLLDRHGSVIGALSTSFAVPVGQQPASLAARARELRAMFAGGVLSSAWLVGGKDHQDKTASPRREECSSIVSSRR